MTNQLLQFDTEQNAQAALPSLYSESGWNTSLCIPNVTVTQEDGTPVSGWFVRVGEDTGLTPFDETGFISSPVFED